VIGAGRRAVLLHSGFQMYGADRAALAIAIELMAQGWSVTVVVPRSGVLERTLREAGASVVIMDPFVLRRAEQRALSLPSWLWLLLKRLARLIRLANGSHFDVVHVNGLPVLGGLIFKARRPGRTRLVWHVHEILERRLPLRLAGLLLTAADVVVACSNAAAAQFPNAGKLPIHAVPSGARPLHRSPAATLPFAGETVTAVCLGRLNAWKGQEDLVSAVPLLQRAGVGVRVKLVGDVFPGQERVRDDLVAQVRRLGVENAVEFCGETAEPELILEQADVAVFPSTSPEPFGMALVEAMSLGRPVIATSIGGPAEIVRSGIDGLLVAPHAPAEIAEAVLAMSRDPQRARALGEAAEERARHFSVEDMAKKVVQLMGSEAEKLR
jgi:glycosyltransferase involved in cell wall biosynthesis